ADPRDRAGVPRAVPLHGRRTEQRDRHGAAPHLPLRVPEQPGRRLRRGDRAERAARDRARAALARVLQGDRALEHLVSDAQERGILSVFDRRRRGVRIGMGVVHALLFTGLVVAGLGPLVWLAKAAVTSTQDTSAPPLELCPSGTRLADAAHAGP